MGICNSSLSTIHHWHSYQSHCLIITCLMSTSSFWFTGQLTSNTRWKTSHCQLVSHIKKFNIYETFIIYRDWVFVSEKFNYLMNKVKISSKVNCYLVFSSQIKPKLLYIVPAYHKMMSIQLTDPYTLNRVLCSDYFTLQPAPLPLKICMLTFREMNTLEGDWVMNGISVLKKRHKIDHTALAQSLLGLLGKIKYIQPRHHMRL